MDWQDRVRETVASRKQLKCTKVAWFNTGWPQIELIESRVARLLPCATLGLMFLASWKGQTLNWTFSLLARPCWLVQLTCHVSEVGFSICDWHLRPHTIALYSLEWVSLLWRVRFGSFRACTHSLVGFHCAYQRVSTFLADRSIIH